MAFLEKGAPLETVNRMPMEFFTRAIDKFESVRPHIFMTRDIRSYAPRNLASNFKSRMQVLTANSPVLSRAFGNAQARMLETRFSQEASGYRETPPAKKPVDIQSVSGYVFSG